MMKQITSISLAAVLGITCLVAAENESPRAVSPIENLTLEQAWEIAESFQPELAEARSMIEAAEGRALQAGLFPNPELVVGAQQLPFNGANQTEYVAGVSQAVPLGQRRAKGRQAELLEREVRARGLEVKRQEIRRRVHAAFATALYQAKACDAQLGILQNAEQTVTMTRARIDAGDAIREDLARVEMERAMAQAELKRAQSLREEAMLALLSAMGDPTRAVKSVAGTLENAFEIPTLENLVANLALQPENAFAQADVCARKARVDAAKADRIPDVKVELLYHRLEATRSDTLDVGLSIPLPLFNRNQGRLREARAEVAAAEARERITQNESLTRLRVSHSQLKAALATSDLLKKEILPRSEMVLKGSEARYAAGDIGLAELLPVRRQWEATQLNYLESLRDIMQAWAELKRFTR